jgi:hypothetical protein
MNFFNLLSSGSSRTSTPHVVFSFNLLNAVSGLGFNNSLEISTPKTLSPEQIVKEPFGGLPDGDSHQVCESGAGESAEKEARVEMFTKQQQLINQYMHLNIQLLSKKLENLEQIEKLPREEEVEQQPEPKSAKKKMYYIDYSERRPTTVATPTRSTMPRECAATVTTSTVETRSLGTVPTISFMLTGCVKTATSTATTENEEKSVMRRLTQTHTAISRRSSVNDFRLIATFTYTAPYPIANGWTSSNKISIGTCLVCNRVRTKTLCELFEVEGKAHSVCFCC